MRPGHSDMRKGPRCESAKHQVDVGSVRRSRKHFWQLLLIMSTVLLAGCAAIVPPKIRVGDGGAPGTLAISRSLAQWPMPSLRLFTGTLVMGHQRVAVLGMWHFRSPWSFRLAVATMRGSPLFALRANWAGVQLLQLRRGFSGKLALAIGHDISLGTRSPKSLGDMRLRRHESEIVARDAWGHNITWQFAGPAGHLRQMVVRRRTGDILTVQYGRYSLRGWPRALSLYRPALDYALILRFGR